MSEASRPQGGQPYQVDVTERGAGGQTLDRRLFVQLQVFTGCADPKPLAVALERSGADAVLYRDVNDSRGVGVLTLTEDPAFFVTRLREVLAAEPFESLTPRPELAMIGRTYASGFEPDLAEWLLERPRRTVLNPAWPWAIWYPLRRTGAFARLSREEQGKILHEHATIGRAYGEADHAHDVRLACYGLDTNDNDFVIGLVDARSIPSPTWSRPCAGPYRPRSTSRSWGRSSWVRRSGSAPASSGAPGYGRRIEKPPFKNGPSVSRWSTPELAPPVRSGFIRRKRYSPNSSRRFDSFHARPAPMSIPDCCWRAGVFVGHGAVADAAVGKEARAHGEIRHQAPLGPVVLPPGQRHAQRAFAALTDHR